MPIQALCFDLDDTLWPVMPVIQRAEQAFYDWLAAHYPRITDHYDIEQLRHMRLRIAEQQPELAHNFTLLRKLALAQAACTVGYAEKLDILIEPAFAAFLAARHQVDLYADTLPVLEQLAEDYPLCALSNGNADVQKVGLSHVFCCAFNAISSGQAKPHPAMFEAACEKLGCEPESMVHIGDDPTCDVQGAQQMGMKAVWLNRAQHQLPDNIRPDAEIASLYELHAVLKSWYA